MVANSAMTVAKEVYPAQFWDVVGKVMQGNFGGLAVEQKVTYARYVCESLGLNPTTSPVRFIKTKMGEVFYLTKDATDQLRKMYGVSIEIIAREQVGDAYVVTARAKTPDGRTDESTGAVWIKGIAGEDYVNALMKAETKAKRRATMSICGLGFLDESETDTVRGSRSSFPIVDADGVIHEPTSISLPFGFRPEQWSNLHSMATAKGVEISPLMTPDQIAGAIRKAGGPAIPGAITPRAIKDALDALTVHQAPSDEYEYAVAREASEDDPYADVAAATDAGRTLPLVKE
jgi:hypothetical protein